MAETAKISDTQHQRATLESIQKFGAENAPLDLRALTESITDNNEIEALKAAENIFSGSPTNTKRFLEIHHQITQGIGHTTHVAAYNSASNALKNQEKEKRSADFAFLNLLDIQRNTIDLINKMVEHAISIHARTESLIQTEQDTNDKILKVARRKYEDGEYTEEDMKSFEAFIIARNEKLSAAEIKNNDLLNRYEELSRDLLQQVTHLPSEGGALVNDLIEQRNHIAQLSEKGDVPQAEINKLNAILEKIDAYTQEHSLEGEREKIKIMFEQLHKCETQLQQLNELMQREQDMSQELLKDIKSGNLSPEELTRRKTELLELTEHVTEQNIHVQNALQAKKPILEEGMESLQNLIGKLAEIEKEEQIIVQRENVIHENMQKYGNRHEQIAQLHGDGITEWVRENTILSGMIGEVTASLYVWGNDLIGRDSKTITAWKNAINHDGKDVYRDNETGELYTYDAEKGERTSIKDPSIIAKLYERAYDKGELFRNETPYSEDPSNTFDQTLESMKQKAEDIKNGINTHATQVIKDKKESLQHKIKAQEAANDSSDTSRDLNLKAVFTPQAEKIKTSDSTLGNNFAEAKEIRSPSLIKVVDNAEHSPQNDTPSPLEGSRIA